MSQLHHQPPKTVTRTRGAAGKAFIVYLGTGSVLAAVIAYFVFSGMGC